MRSRLFGVLFVSTLFLFGHVLGGVPKTVAQTSPVGRWTTVDDATGKVKSVVALWEENGKLFGKIEEVINADPDNPGHVCLHCEGDLKNKPLVGLRILWDMQKDGDQWSGGKILDPHNGKVYRCTVALQDGGKKLKVRGFIGFSLLGRTQYWSHKE
ncbi:MAG TPA: DUF2147 domain-containing protein [Candidatus Sulfotelmatobacter sp.]|nr:DUF2147 domain-containing protein [Candidatus Sulfotelmatobacter sp.]